MKRSSKYYKVYNYSGQTKNGRWLRKSLRKKFIDINLFIKYIDANNNRIIFGKYTSGTFCFTRASIDFIKKLNNK